MLFGSFRAPRSLLVWNIDSQSNLTNRFLSFLNVKSPMTKMSRGQRTVFHFSYIISFISIDLSYHFLWSNLVESRMSLPNITFFFFCLMFLPRLHKFPHRFLIPPPSPFSLTIDTHTTFSFLSFFFPFFSPFVHLSLRLSNLFFSLFFLFLIFSDHYCPYNFFFFSAPFLFFLF